MRKWFRQNWIWLVVAFGFVVWIGLSLQKVAHRAKQYEKVQKIDRRVRALERSFEKCGCIHTEQGKE